MLSKWPPNILEEQKNIDNCSLRDPHHHHTSIISLSHIILFMSSHNWKFLLNLQTYSEKTKDGIDKSCRSLKKSFRISTLVKRFEFLNKNFPQFCEFKILTKFSNVLAFFFLCWIYTKKKKSSQKIQIFLLVRLTKKIQGIFFA